MQKTYKSLDDKLLVGRSEWCALPKLNIPAIKAKVDTGAKTSAIHAFNMRTVLENGVEYVCFDIHPLQNNDQIACACRAPVVDLRTVMSSNGQKEKRYVIATTLEIASQHWDIELTLSNRDPLRYRMLLGREALKGRVLVDPGISCHQTKLTRKDVVNLYDSSQD